jgi:hypothetical protein
MLGGRRQRKSKSIKNVSRPERSNASPETSSRDTTPLPCGSAPGLPGTSFASYAFRVKKKKEFSTGRKTTVSVQEKLSSSEKAQGRWDGDWDARYEWTTGIRESVILWVSGLVDEYYLQELANHSRVSCSFSLLLDSLSVWFRLRVRSGRACESWSSVFVLLFIPRIIALDESSDKKLAW